MKTIGIVGTRKRDYNDTRTKIVKKFFEIYEKGDWICSGGCPKGGDRFAEEIAEEHGIPIITFYPAWNDLKAPGAVIRYRYGKPYNANAGFARNTPIAQISHVIIASVAPDRKGGTEDTLRKFKAEGKSDVHLV